jgi:hypothetical protein
MAHRWKFFRAGGFDQVRLDAGADIAALGELDPKLWLALSCPTKGLELDPHTLELLDADKDARIRVQDVVAASKWVTSLLKNPDELTKAVPALPLASIDDKSEEGRRIIASAKEILRSLGKADAVEIVPADIKDTVAIFSKTLFNGDGIVPAEAGEAEVAAAIKDIIACLGPDKDASGLDGVSKAKVDRFFTEAASYVTWWKKAESDPEILPLLDRTQAAFAAWDAIRQRVDDYFVRCALAATDPRAAAALHPPDSVYAALATAEPALLPGLLEKLPLARIEPSRPLPLDEGVNPAWAAAAAALKEKCVLPILGERHALTKEEWSALSQRFFAHRAWLDTKPAQSVEKLGIARLKDLTEGGAKQAIEALIAKDAAFEPHAKAIASVDKIAHLYRDLHGFLNNFVAFRDFYTKRAKAIFQAGTLFLDGRGCELTIRVEDAAKHAALAGHSMMCLAYCDCVRKGGTEKLTIAAAFTGGDSDFLIAGRNGVFYDRKGQEWDATITKLIEQPISIRQAFWQPYKRVARFVSEQVEKFGGTRDKESTEKLTAGLGTIGQPDPKAEPGKAAPAAFDVAKFAGIFAAIGLAVGAIGTAMAAVFTGFVSLAWWQMPLAIVGVLIAISGPSLLLAANKLRRRNLGPLLDANGWAINARAMINIPFGGSLTQLATLPPGSERSLKDPYAEKRRPWLVYAVMLIVVAAAVAWAYMTGLIQLP